MSKFLNRQTLIAAAIGFTVAMFFYEFTALGAGILCAA